ncbi:MAG: hypothetical protein K8R88_13950 [Armatimonadetes bacterium]|nr:hypothetical protein [Armatimonadota bacterium]
MKFRKLYWVTEEVCDQESRVNGVFTSFVDLIDKGLTNTRCRTRLSLFKLDCQGPPLGTWTTDDFVAMDDDLAPFVSSGEFSAEDCKALVEAFGKIAQVTA